MRYNNLKILNNEEKKEILKKLNKKFSIQEIPGELIQRGAERIFIFTGNLNKKEIKQLERAIPIERAGIYFGKIQNNEIRLSIEGTQIMKNQIKKNIFELNKNQVQRWMQGNELNIKTGKEGFLIMKYKDDLLGCGKASELKISNFIPKNRRLKEKNE
jgi:NOL1/NOP2/fmu family ribosome biogenesis protein